MSHLDEISLLVPGRVVRMRDRLWRVDRVDGDEFAASPLDGRDVDSRRFDRRLERVEEGSTPYPSVDSLGSADEQRLTLDAYRLSLLHGTAPILGLQRSRAIPTDFQLVPLLLSMSQERVRLLIADDVGTGKTIEAGLVLAELMARGLARRVLVVVPANLRDQWAEALDHFFHIDATVVSGHLLPALERRLLPGQSVWSAHDVVVASIDYLKTRTQTVLDNGWDAIIVDEAHIAGMPHTLPGQSEPDMARWRFVTEAARRCRHLLLLTATPHNGYSDSYASLFSMLDPDLVAGEGATGTVRRERARSHVVQRRRADIEAWYVQQGRPSPFPRRDPEEYIVFLQRGTRETELKVLLRELGGYTDALVQADTTRPINGWVAAHLQRRALSSPRAIQESIRNRMRAVSRRAVTDADRRATAEARAAVADLAETADATDEEQVTALDVAAVALPVDDELAYLKQLAALAAKVTPAKDPKLDMLLAVLPRRIATHPQVPRVMVFTKYRDTLDYLVGAMRKPPKALSERLPDGTGIFEIHGEMTLAERRRVFGEFERAEPAVLVATDCISEGLNLQHACAEIVHYELPWNPNRLEQRNGRVDRFGQREEFVGISTLVLDDPLDAAMLELIVKKAEEMRSEYGFVPPFLANADILAHLSNVGAQHRRQRTLFEHQAEEAMAAASAERGRALVDQAVGDADLLDHDRTEAIKAESFYGHSDVSLGDVETALDRSRAEIGSGDAVRAFLRRSLAGLHGVHIEDQPGGMIRLTGSDPDLDGVLPPPEQILSFQPEDGFADPEVDVVDVAHPLLRRLVDLARDRAADPDATGRIAGRTSPAATTVTGICHVLARYVAHADPPVLMEELLEVPVPVWGDDPTPDAADLLAGGPGRAKPADELTDAATTLLNRPDLRDRLAGAAAERAGRLAARHDTLDAPWAAGLDDVEVMSTDLIAVTLCYPEPR